jgi:hypothetical protein
MTAKRGNREHFLRPHFTCEVPAWVLWWQRTVGENFKRREIVEGEQWQTDAALPRRSGVVAAANITAPATPEAAAVGRLGNGVEARNGGLVVVPQAAGRAHSRRKRPALGDGGNQCGRVQGGAR